MGTKAGILAFGGDIAAALRRKPSADPERTRALVGAAFPGYEVEPAKGSPLSESTYPDDDIAYALSAPGIDIVCDRRFMIRKPSELPEHMLGLAAGHQAALCQMHSADDSFGYAIWNDGELVRSLSMSPMDGIVEDIGEPLEFERPFWARPGAAADLGPGSLGFRTLDLGQQAMRFLFGFALEGRPEPGEAYAGEVTMLGFEVTDPTGAEHAAREAALAEFRRTHTRRSYRIGPDGSLVEADN